MTAETPSKASSFCSASQRSSKKAVLEMETQRKKILFLSSSVQSTDRITKRVIKDGKGNFHSWVKGSMSKRINIDAKR